MNKKTTVLLASLLGLTISAGIVVGASYALFTGKRTVNNHLKAGNLTVGLHRVAYTQYIPDEKGLMAKVTDTTSVDLTKNADPVFSAMAAVPGSYYEAKVAVSNDGSVAFTHGLRLLWDEENATEAEKLFAEQLMITVTCGEDEEKRFLLSDCDLPENEMDLGLVYKEEYKTFTVTAAFLDVADNNEVQDTEIAFDLQVFATQYVGE